MIHMNKTLRLLMALILLANVSFGQSISGEIYGRVVDEKGQPLDYASVQALEGGLVRGGNKTDQFGNYKIKPLQPGKYTIKVTFAGYSTQEIQNINVGVDKRVQVDIQMEKKPVSGPGVTIKEFKIKLVDASDPGKKSVFLEESPSPESPCASCLWDPF